MPGLIRAVGRTAVVAGTATAVSGNATLGTDTKNPSTSTRAPASCASPTIAARSGMVPSAFDIAVMLSSFVFGPMTCRATWRSSVPSGCSRAPRRRRGGSTIPTG